MLLKPLSTVLLAALLGSGLALQAQAQPLKIGYVSSERVMSESTTGKAATKKLEREFGKREEEISAMAAKLKAAAGKLDKEAAAISG